MSEPETAPPTAAPDSRPQRLKVCIVALHALPAIDPTLDRPVGGTETRAWTFARGLASTGKCNVSFVVRSDCRRSVFWQDGVEINPRVDRLYSLYESVGRCVERSSRFPGLRLRRWEWPLLWQAPLLAACRLIERGSRSRWRTDRFLMQRDADVFCTFGVQANSARVIASAHATGRKAVLMIGSDGDLDERYRPGSNFVGPYGDVAELCYEILQRADRIVAQTSNQQRILADRFQRTSRVIANPIDLSAWDARRSTRLSDEVTGGLRRYALWVGRAESQHKRPELLLELARLCPDVDFLMILNPRDRPVEQNVRGTAPANVRIVSHVPFDLMPAIFDRAAVFVSTSALEGFPNVFLQAAAAGVPIASLEVGQEFIEAARCGNFAEGSIERLAAFVRSAWGAAANHDQQAASGRAFVAAEHDLSRQSIRLLQEFPSLLSADS